MDLLVSDEKYLKEMLFKWVSKNSLLSVHLVSNPKCVFCIRLFVSILSSGIDLRFIDVSCNN